METRKSGNYGNLEQGQKEGSSKGSLEIKKKFLWSLEGREKVPNEETLNVRRKFRV